MPLFIDSWWGRLCIWSIHDPIFAMLLNSFHKLWLSNQALLEGRKACIVLSQRHIEIWIVVQREG